MEGWRLGLAYLGLVGIPGLLVYLLIRINFKDR